MVDSSTSAAPPSASATSPTTSPDQSWRPAASDPDYTPDCEEPRIRAHVQLCALALLLIRVVENTTGDTWRNVRHELDRLHLVTLQTAQGTVAQRTTLTLGQKTILKALHLDEPRRFYDFTTPAT